MICKLCDRDVELFSKHHLIPRQKKGRVTVKICDPCNTTIHKLFTNKEMAKEFNTVEKLRRSERMQKYLKWIKKRDNEMIPRKTKKRRHR